VPIVEALETPRNIASLEDQVYLGGQTVKELNQVNSILTKMFRLKDS
jgi:hypothetical protein